MAPGTHKKYRGFLFGAKRKRLKEKNLWAQRNMEGIFDEVKTMN